MIRFRFPTTRILFEWQKNSMLEISRFKPPKRTLVTCSARLAKLNRFESSQIAIPDARKVSALWKWPTTALRRKQSRNSMEKKSAGATSLSTKHGQCKIGTSTTAVGAVAADDIETVENGAFVPTIKREI